MTDQAPWRDDEVERWRQSGISALPPEGAAAILRDPDLLAGHDPQFQRLVKTVRFTGRPEHADLLKREIRVRKLVAMARPDPFVENLPPAGVLPPPGQGRVPLVRLPMGGVLSLEIGLRGISRNIILCGATGAGKTNALLLLLLAASGLATIVAFDRKGDLGRLAGFAQAGEVVVLDARDLQLAMFQPMPGMNAEEFIALMTEMLARHLHWEASKRFISDCLYVLFSRRGGRGVCLGELIELVERVRADALSRLGQYREATMYALKDLLRRSGGILNYVQSNMLEQVFSRPRTFIIRAGSIPIDHATTIASLFYMYVYETRRHSGQKEPPVLMVLDDALPLVVGSMAQESEGGMNPISNWSFLGRGLNIGLVVSAQNFSLISPAIRNNTDTIVCLGSYGEDAAAVARHMNLTAEAAAILPTLRPGEAVVQARSEWPLAVKGWVPEVK